jgi:integrase/recombinase XerD
MPESETRSLIVLPSRSLTEVNHPAPVSLLSLGDQIARVCQAWLAKSPSPDTRANYERDIVHFAAFSKIGGENPERLADIRPELLIAVRPEDVAAWRDHLQGQGLKNSSIRRKMTALRSLFSFLQTCGYAGLNPAHGDFVAAPAAPRGGKTVAFSTSDCRRLLDAPEISTVRQLPDGTKEEAILPAGIRDRAIFAVLAYTGIRVGELTRLTVGSRKQSSGLHVLEVMGKGGKERLVPLHPESVERLEAWLDVAGIREDANGPLFRPVKAARDHGHRGFAARPMTRRAVQKLVERYVTQLGLDRNVTVHSFRVTALTTARERGSDIIDLQDFAGHADPRTTLTYIRNRDRLSNSPAYVLKY